MDFKAGDKVRHYKGNEYEIVGFAEHTERGEELVIYKRLNDPGILKYNLYARPATMFYETIARQRFEKIEKEEW